MVDQTHFAESGEITPYANAVAVTPADTDFTHDEFTRAIYVGVTGDLAVLMADNKGDTVAVVFTAVPAGKVLRLRTKQILSTGTTATNIVALF